MNTPFGGAPWFSVATLTVNDNDTAGITVVESGTPPATTVAEGSTTTDDFTVVLTSQPSAAVTVTATVQDTDECAVRRGSSGNFGTSAAMTFVAASATSPQTLWNAAQTVQVQSVQDTDVDGDQDCVINLTTASTDTNYAAAASVTGRVTATVTDDETIPITLAIAAPNDRITEGGSTTVSASVAAGQTSASAIEVTLTPATSPDFTWRGGTRTLTIPANMTTSGTVTIDATDDTIDEDRETVSISGTTTATGYSVTAVDLEIDDNDTAMLTVTQTGGSLTVAEGSTTTDSFTVRLATQPTHPVTVTATSQDTDECRLRVGSGNFGNSATMTFVASSPTSPQTLWSTTQTVEVQSVQDSVDDGTQDCDILLATASTDANYGSDTTVPDQTVEGTTTDDNDAAGLTVTQTGGSLTVAEGSTTADSFTVRLNSQPTAAVTVTATSQDTDECQLRVGSGSYGTMATLSFTASTQATLWSTAQTVEVRSVDDSVDDGTQDCDILLATTSTDANYGSNTVVPDRTVEGTTTDNDTAGLTVVESSSSTTVAEGSTTADSFTVRLNSQPTAAVTVTATSQDTDECQLRVGSGSYGNTATMSFTASTPATLWSTAQTVEVRSVDDSVDDGTQNCRIALTTASTDASYSASASVTATVTATVTDNDTAGLTVTESGMPAATTVAEGSATADDFTVRLTSEPTAAVTVTATVQDADECAVRRGGSGNYGTSVTLTFVASSPGSGQAQWNSGHTVQVQSVDDDVVDGAQNCRINLAAGGGDANYGSSVTATVTASVTDDDTAGITVTESGSSTSVAEGSTATDSFTVVLDSEPTAAVTVTATSGDPGECRVRRGSSGSFGTSATLTFVASSPSSSQALWNAAQTVQVQSVDDSQSDGTVTCNITVAAASTAGDSNYNSDTTVPDETVAVSVTDNDQPGLTVTETGGSTEVAESGTTDTFMVRLNTQPTHAVTVAATAGDATECEVRLGSSGAFGTSATMTFVASSPTSPQTLWNAAQTVQVRGKDDNIDDGPVNCVITLATASTAGDTNYNSDTTVPDRMVTAVVADDDEVGLALIPERPVLEAREDDATTGNTASFTVALATLPSASVTVTATAGDSTECEVRIGTMGSYMNSVSMTFTPSTPATLWSLARTVTVRGKDDNDRDGSKECDITLATSSTGDTDYGSDTTVPDRDVDVTVLDDEAPTVTLVSSVAATDGEIVLDEGDTFTLTAELSFAVETAATLTVTAAGRDGSGATEARAGSGDWRLSGATLTVDANETSSATAAAAARRRLTFTAVDDRTDEPARLATVTAMVSGARGAQAPMELQVRIRDDDEAPTVTLAAADAAIWEDTGETTVSAELSNPSSADTTVTVLPEPGVYEVVGGAATGGSALGRAAPALSVRSNHDRIVIPAGQTTSADRVRIRAINNANRQDRDPIAMIRGRVTNAQSGHTEESPAMAAPARVTVWDDETSSVTLRVEPTGEDGEPRVTEGGTARVSAVLTRPSRGAVTLTVSAEPGRAGDEPDYFRLGTQRRLPVAAGATMSEGSVEILAVDDETDAPDRTVTISAIVDEGDRARNPEPVTLTIEDDDDTPQATLVLTPAVIDESGDPSSATVTATLDRPSSAATTITVSASSAQGAGFFTRRGETLTIMSGQTSSTGSVTIAAVDDEEQTPDREVRVSGAATNARGADHVRQPEAVILTIRDDDGTDEVTAVLLPEAARAMADSRATAVRQRLERAGTEAAAGEMPTLTGLLERHGPAAQSEEGLDWKRNLLPQASFALPLDGAGGSGGGVTVWGGGDYRDLDGEARGVKWDGEVVSAHLGADRLLANGLRLGLAASWSEATFDYETRNQDGEWTLEMGSAQPYLGWTTDGGVSLWATAGYGEGELEVDRGRGRSQTADADMRMAAAGARALVREAYGLEVSLRGEALYSRFEVDDNGDGITGMTSDATRLRLALEARRERALASGALLSPRFELGARHDGGDGETGAGAEVGAGVDYVSGRLTASVGARGLVANSDYDEWGADLALAYSPGADGRGMSFRLAPTWGTAASGTQELWEQGATGLNGAADEPAAGARMEAKLGYGLKSPLSRGLLTLAAEGEWGEDAGSVCRLTGAVALDAASSLGLELELREPKSGDAGRSLMLTAELRF